LVQIPFGKCFRKRNKKKKKEERGRANHPSSAQHPLPFSPPAPAR